MKRVFFIIIVFFFSILALRAQFTMAGGGIGYTTGYNFRNQNSDADKSKSIDIFLKGVYELKGKLQISPSFTFFIPANTTLTSPIDESKISLNSIMLDINGHYIFNPPGKSELYALAGVDILFALRKEVLTITSPVSSTDTYSESDNAIGLNLGAGVCFKVSERLNLFMEAKYLLGKYDQFMFNAGIMLNIQ